MSWPSPPFVLLVGGLHLRAAEQQGQQHRGATQHHTHYRQVHGRLTAVWQPPALRHDIKDVIGGSLQLAPCGAMAVVHSRGPWCALHTGTAYPATHGTPGPRQQLGSSAAISRVHISWLACAGWDGCVAGVVALVSHVSSAASHGSVATRPYPSGTPVTVGWSQFCEHAYLPWPATTTHRRAPWRSGA